MEGADHFVLHGARRVAAPAGLGEVPQALEMTRGLRREHLRQFRVDTDRGGRPLVRFLTLLFVCDRRGWRSGGVARCRHDGVGKCKGARHDGFAVQLGTPPLRLTLHQVREQRRGLVQQIGNFGGCLERSVDDPVEHVLNRPGELADRHGPDHSAAALQRVKRASQSGQCIAVVAVVEPPGQGLADGRHLISRLFNEDIQDLRIDLVLVFGLVFGLFVRYLLFAEPRGLGRTLFPGACGVDLLVEQGDGG